MAHIEVFQKDNIELLEQLESETINLIYIDPPFNTGITQKRTTLKTKKSEDGDRIGFQGKKYKTEKLGTLGYVDIFDDFLEFLEPRLSEAHRVLSNNGSLFFHIDYREVHYCKILLDYIFGRECFINEIIWAFDYGARSKTKWPVKHNNILWYAKNPDNYIFNLDACDRIEYMAPSLVGAKKAEKGKTPTDTWWHTIVSPNGKEKTGYPTQKPLGILERIVKVHSNENDLLLDFFAGSGSFGEAGYNNNRNVILCDTNPEAIEVMKKRFINYNTNFS
jgi:site-specific DNA-methyltransferase (adenine-specific)